LRILLFIAFFTFFSASAQQDTTVYSLVDREAEFPGGVAAMIKWLHENIVYPNEIIGGEIINRIYITFIVETENFGESHYILTKMDSCSIKWTKRTIKIRSTYAH